MTTTAIEPSPAAVGSGRHLIVVGMDNDPASLVALRFAASEAAYRGGTVLAVHVLHYPTSWGFPGVWPAETHPRRHVETALQEIVESLTKERAATGHPFVAVATEVRQGVLADEIAAAAKDAALLVLGTRHHSWFEGSVSHAATKHPPCPVVIVAAP